MFLVFICRSIPKLASAGDLKRNKARKRQALLRLLEPDLVGNDPRVSLIHFEDMDLLAQ